MYTVAFFIKRRPGMSRDAFLEYYEERHGPYMVEMMKDRGLVTYDHFPVELPPGVPDGATLFDGFSIYGFETMAQADACWALPEVLADGQAFIDMNEMVKLAITRRRVFGQPDLGLERQERSASHARASVLIDGRPLAMQDGINMIRTAAPRFERYGRTGLRMAMVVVFLVFGSQKFTAIEAMGILPFVSHSPLTAWLLSLGVRNMSRVFGTAEVSFGLLLASGLWREGALPAILGATGSCVTFLTTLSFLLTTPGVVANDAAPVLSSDGLFLVKDLVLLSASVLLLAQSLAARERDDRRTPTGEAFIVRKRALHSAD